MTYGIGNPGPGMGQVQNVTGLNWLIVSQPSPINSCINIFTNIEMITFLE